LIRSMTGFGGAQYEDEGIRIQIDIRSVNNRFFDFHPRLPRDMQFLEGELLEGCRKVLKRGRVTLQLTVESDAAGSGPSLNEDVFQSYLNILERVTTEGGFRERGTATGFLALPELLGGEDRGPEREFVRERVMKTLNQALQAIVEMKKREGETLVIELKKRLGLITDSLSTIETQAPMIREALKENLKSRLEELLGATPVDPQRLAQEAAILVDRADITEEIVRLGSHLTQFGEILGTGGEVAKKLGFILQEMLRETNTIGSKTQALAIINEVLLIKEEIEKLREQILNLE
jgi:uncharacterized protein (TIGR00255 family)